MHCGARVIVDRRGAEVASRLEVYPAAADNLARPGVNPGQPGRNARIRPFFSFRIASPKYAAAKARPQKRRNPDERAIFAMPRPGLIAVRRERLRCRGSACRRTPVSQTWERRQLSNELTVMQPTELFKREDKLVALAIPLLLSLAAVTLLSIGQLRWRDSGHLE